MDAESQREALGRFASTLGDAPALGQGFNAWQVAELDSQIEAFSDAGKPVPPELERQRATAGKALTLGRDSPNAGPVVASPLYQLIGATRVNGLRLMIEGGDGGAVVEAMACCAMHGLVAPGWLATAFATRYQRVAVGDAKSWDDPAVFGPAVPAGTNVAGVRAAQQRAPAAHGKALELLSEDPARPIDKGFYEAVGEAVGTGATQAEKLIAQYVESGQGTWPTPSEIKPYLLDSGGDLTVAWLKLRDEQMQARWLAAGGTLEQWKSTYEAPRPE